MANSTSPVPQAEEGSNAVAKINELFDAGSQTLIGGRNAATSALLVWGYLGGRIAGINVANGTLTLGASTTSYVVMKKSDGVVSFSTGTTNWDNSTDYWRLYSVVTNTTTVSDYIDERSSATGLFGLPGVASPGGSTTQIQYNNAGALAGSASFTWDNANSRVNTVNITTTGLVLTAASATGGAGFRLPHGVAPTSPTNGDVWTESTGLYAQINGSTVGPYATAAGSLTNPMTSVGDIIIGSTAGAPARLAVGTNTSDVLGVTSGSPAWLKRTPLIIPIACSDETTALTAGTAKVTFRMPCAMTLLSGAAGVRASVTTAPTGSVLTVDINESGSTILSTKLTIDASEKTSTTAATPAVISDTSLADDAEITIDIDGVGSTIAGAGLKVYLIGYPA